MADTTKDKTFNNRARLKDQKEFNAQTIIIIILNSLYCFLYYSYQNFA